MVTFDSLAGVPVHAAHEGTRGTPATFRCGPGFHGKLDACFAELWSIRGRAEVITTTGAFREIKGMHRQGRAFDLDGVFWPDRSMVAYRDGWMARNRRLYYGVEALLRKHFGTVNDFWVDGHKGHLHVDDGTGVGFRRGSRAQVYFIQGSLNEFHAAGLLVDGVYGPKSRDALARVAGDVTAPAGWLAFLDAVARRGLAHDDR